GDQLRFLNYILRKAGHSSEYFILLALALRAFQSGRPELRWYSPIAALALCAGFAATDEFHQLFVSGRTGNMRDVLIDLTGSVVSLSIILLWFAVKAVERRLLHRNDIYRQEEAQPVPLVAKRVSG